MITYESIADFTNIVLFILISLSISIVVLLLYHGAFCKVEVKCLKPPYEKDLLIVYKFTQNYAESWVLLAEAQEIAPELDSFSIYHEDFYQRSRVGASVGVILAENMQESLYLKLVQVGFRPAVLPAVDYAVVASFPNRSRCSLTLALHRIYPALRRYIKANHLCAHPILELYTKETLFFIAPLSKQFDFYAEEAIIPYGEDLSSEEEPEPNELKKVKRRLSKINESQSEKEVTFNLPDCDPLLVSSSCERCRRTL